MPDPTGGRKPWKMASTGSHCPAVTCDSLCTAKTCACPVCRCTACTKRRGVARTERPAMGRGGQALLFRTTGPRFNTSTHRLGSGA